jgi:pilus assembly protein CpaE
MTSELLIEEMDESCELRYPGVAGETEVLFGPSAAPALPSAASVPASCLLSSSQKGLLMGIFSGRGGVGKSALALMLSLVARERGLRTTLIDLDLQFGDISYLAGQEERGCLRKRSLEELLALESVPVGDRGELLIVEAPSQPEQAELLLPRIPLVLEHLMTSFDFVVANTGSFWNELHAELASRCDHLVFLMDQRSTSVTACKQAIDLCIRMQLPQARFLFALNGCGRYAALSAQDVSLALGGVDVCEIADGGSLVDELLALGRPGELVRSGNAFVSSLDDLLGHLTFGHLSLEYGHASEKAGRVEGGEGKVGGKGIARLWPLANLAALFARRGRLGHAAS